MSVEQRWNPAGAVPTVGDLLADLELLADRASGHAAAALSPGTRKAYESDWRQWKAWCDLHDTDPLPVDPHFVRLYVADMASQIKTDGSWRLKASTIERHLAALAWMSRSTGGIHDFARHPLVNPVLAGIRRNRGEKPKRARPTMLEDLTRLISSMDHHTFPAGVITARDRLALLLGFAAALRRSEVANLSLNDVRPVPLDGIHIHLGATKTDQDGLGAVLAIPFGENPITCTPCAHIRWLRLIAAPKRADTMRLVFETGQPDTWTHVCHGSSAVTGAGLAPSAPLFRAVPKSGRIGSHPITPGALNNMMKRRLIAAGYDPTLYGFHSLRAGFVTQARRNGATTRAVRRQTRHASDATVDIYDREHLPLSGNAVLKLGL